ncbi:MAG: nitric oxide synthase, partial [Desulfobacteraceae bacterium 4572_123]
LLAEGIRIAGHQASVVAVNEIKKEADLEGYDAVVFGSPTYHGDMMQKMKTLLFLAEKVNLEGKIGGAFGAFEWSGEAPGRICDTMENIFKMDMAAGPLMLKSADLGGGLQMAHEYGKKIAAKM